MREYEKIETLFCRDMEGTRRLIPGQWQNATVQYLQNLPWEWTEKIDGTNIRVFWDGHSVRYSGRTDNSQIPVKLYDRLQEIFGGEDAEQLFEQMFGEKEVILFGEGYGSGIMKCGKDYIPDGIDFILFDVLIGDNYQTRKDVQRTATAFGIKFVPVVGNGTLQEAVDFVKTRPHSFIGECEMEGVVCRPTVELRDRCGSRVIAKVKVRDHCV